MPRRDHYSPGAGLSGDRRYQGSPPAATIQYVRISARLTQREAARLIFISLRQWQRFEEGERPIHTGLWELFCRKLAEL